MNRAFFAAQYKNLFEWRLLVGTGCEISCMFENILSNLGNKI